MSKSITTEEKLQERIKELSCLYNVSSVLAKHKENLNDTFFQIVQILKKAWRFSEAATVEIVINEDSYSTGVVPQKTVSQRCNIYVFNEKCGSISVFYPAPQFSEKDFLQEEKQLLKKVAYEISNFYEKQKNKEKEEILKRTAQRNDRLVILGEITAGIAHELNTPLGNILGFAEFIAENSTDPQVTSDISKIIKSAIYSREVVKKLMFFACEMPQNMDLIDIKPLVLQVLSLLGPNFKKAEVHPEFQITNENIKARFDSIQFSQVLFNILINAIYISPKDGKIGVNVSNDENFLFIEISDEGPGIDEEIRSRIFEPFFTTKPLGEGSGLGLSVVHGIVRSHKGTITTFNNNPRGTVVKITLPLSN